MWWSNKLSKTNVWYQPPPELLVKAFGYKRESVNTIEKASQDSEERKK